MRRMGSRTATNALVKRTTFSSAINIFPNEVASNKATTPENIINENDGITTKQTTQIRSYSEVPGPKGLPLIGNSWRFAPLIGKAYLSLALEFLFLRFFYHSKLYMWVVGFLFVVYFWLHFGFVWRRHWPNNSDSNSNDDFKIYANIYKCVFIF